MLPLRNANGAMTNNVVQKSLASPATIRQKLFVVTMDCGGDISIRSDSNVTPVVWGT